MARFWGLTPGQFRDLSDDEQDEMTAYMTDVCPSCGNLRSVCSDPERAWYPQREMCYASAATELTRRRLAKRYEDKPPGTADLHDTDGMRLWSSQEDLTPDDDCV